MVEAAARAGWNQLWIADMQVHGGMANNLIGALEYLFMLLVRPLYKQVIPQPDYGGAANAGAANVNAAQINAHNAWRAGGNGRGNDAVDANVNAANQRIYIHLPKWKELNYFSNRAYFLWNKSWDYVDESLTNNRK